MYQPEIKQRKKYKEIIFEAHLPGNSISWAIDILEGIKECGQFEKGLKKLIAFLVRSKEKVDQEAKLFADVLKELLQKRGHQNHKDS